MWSYTDSFFVIILDGKIFAFNRPDEQAFCYLRKMFKKFSLSSRALTRGEVILPNLQFLIGQITMDKENFPIDLGSIKFYSFKLERLVIDVIYMIFL